MGTLTKILPLLWLKTITKNLVMPADRFPVGLSVGFETYHRLTGPLMMSFLLD